MLGWRFQVQRWDIARIKEPVDGSSWTWCFSHIIHGSRRNSMCCWRQKCGQKIRNPPLQLVGSRCGSDLESRVTADPIRWLKRINPVQLKDRALVLKLKEQVAEALETKALFKTVSQWWETELKVGLMDGYQSYLRKRKQCGRKMIRFLSDALDQAKEEIASGSKEALTDYHRSDMSIGVLMLTFDQLNNFKL